MRISLLRSPGRTGNFGSSLPPSSRGEFACVGGQEPLELILLGRGQFLLVGLREAEVQADGGHLPDHVPGEGIEDTQVPRLPRAGVSWDEGRACASSRRSGSRKRCTGGRDLKAHRRPRPPDRARLSRPRLPTPGSAMSMAAEERFLPPRPIGATPRRRGFADGDRHLVRLGELRQAAAVRRHDEPEARPGWSG